MNVLKTIFSESFCDALNNYSRDVKYFSPKMILVFINSQADATLMSRIAGFVFDL